MDATHNPKLKSWVESANDPAHAIFRSRTCPSACSAAGDRKEAPRGGVAIGDQILDLAAVGLKTGPNLNNLAGAGRKAWRELRKVALDRPLRIRSRRSASRSTSCR